MIGHDARITGHDARMAPYCSILMLCTLDGSVRDLARHKLVACTDLAAGVVAQDRGR